MSQDFKTREPRKASGTAIAILEPRLPYLDEIKARTGLDRAQWQTLTDSVWPSASSVAGVLLALDYCRVRKLDPFKRPVHVVPIYDRTRGCMVDTVWPGISELRTTATRTGVYAGCDEAIFGPDKNHEFVGSSESTDDRTGEVTTTQRKKMMTIPEWCSITVWRIVAGQRVAFPGPKVFWLEAYATAGKNSEFPNEMWSDRARGQLEKCAEAAALRRAFPEELGGEFSFEEMERTAGKEQPIDGAFRVVGDAPPPRPERADFKEQAKPAAIAPPPIPAIDAAPVRNLVLEQAEEAASGGVEKLKAFWKRLNKDGGAALAPEKDRLKKIAEAADAPPPPAEATPERPAREQGYIDYLADQDRALANCVSLRSVDELQESVEAALKDEPEDLAKFVSACKAKATELMRGKTK